MEKVVLEAILGGGGVAVVAVLLFYLYRNESQRREAITDRYIAHLESEAADDDLAEMMEAPTRPVRPDMVARAAAKR
jgi:hypothetical protein